MSIIVPYLPRIYHFFFSKRRQRATGSRRCTKSAVHGKVGHVPRRRHAFHRPYLNTRTYVSGRRPREDEAERVGDSRVLGERGNSKKMLLRLLAAAAGRAKTPGVNSARRERKKKKETGPRGKIGKTQQGGSTSRRIALRRGEVLTALCRLLVWLPSRIGKCRNGTAGTVTIPLSHPGDRAFRLEPK